MTVLYFNDLLERAGITPDTVLLMRHTPNEPSLQRILPWLSIQEPDVYNTYQSAQNNKKAEAALKKVDYLASFIGMESHKTHFVGLYRRNSQREISEFDYRNTPEYKKLLDYGMSKAPFKREKILAFDLEQQPLLSGFAGKLILDWESPRNWYRQSGHQEFSIHAILETSAFDLAMPSWRNLILTWRELKDIHQKWQDTLKEWRGIYLIFDQSDGKAYVGSAYGTDNIGGRWQEYIETGHGGNKYLKDRESKNFKFSILERLSPDMDKDEVIERENTWKDRLHTRHPSGLNGN